MKFVILDCVLCLTDNSPFESRRKKSFYHNEKDAFDPNKSLHEYLVELAQRGNEAQGHNKSIHSEDPNGYRECFSIENNEFRTHTMSEGVLGGAGDTLSTVNFVVIRVLG